MTAKFARESSTGDQWPRGGEIGSANAALQAQETPLVRAGPSTPPTGLPSDHGGTASTAPTGLLATHLDPGSASTAPTALPNRVGSSSPTSQTLSYGYDKHYRLTSASGGPSGSTSYTYDPVGNRMTRTRASTTTTYAYDRADRISSATTPSGSTSYTVNAVGNMTARGSDTLAYDQANRLTGTTVGSTTASYVYDGDGKRASKTVSSTTTPYVYDLNRGLPVLLEDGTRRYVWGLGLAYDVESSTPLVYHVDGLGSVRALSDSTKVVVQTYESDEFGVPIIASGGSSRPFGFTGDLHFGDQVLAYKESDSAFPTIADIVSRSGHRTLRISFEKSSKESEIQDVVKQLRNAGACVENYNDRFYAIDVPPESDYMAICDYLWRLEEHRRLIYETGATTND